MIVFLGKYCLDCYKLRSKVDYEDEKYMTGIIHAVYCVGCKGGYRH